MRVLCYLVFLLNLGCTSSLEKQSEVLSSRASKLMAPDKWRKKVWVFEVNDFRAAEYSYRFKARFKENKFPWEDPKLSLGYIKIGQVDIQRSFGDLATFKEIYSTMSNNLNIKSIKNMQSSIKCDYPYSLASDNWKQMQIEGLENGYKSRSVR